MTERRPWALRNYSAHGRHHISYYLFYSRYRIPLRAAISALAISVIFGSAWAKSAR